MTNNMENAVKAIAHLVEMGVAFDGKGKNLAMTLDAPHSRPRMLHSADTTGGVITALFKTCENGYIVYCCNFLFAHSCSCSSGSFSALSCNSGRVWGWSGYCSTIASSAVCRGLASYSSLR